MTIQQPVKAPIRPDAQTVTEVKHWSDTLFFVPRDPSCIAAVPLGRVCDDRVAEG